MSRFVWDRGNFDGQIVRTDDLKRRYEDVVNPLLTYVGYPRNLEHGTDVSQWQIYRLVRQGDVLIKEFPQSLTAPNKESSEYEFKWDDRATLTFPSGPAPVWGGSSAFNAIPEIFNLSVPVADVEFTQAIPDGMTNFGIWVRNGAADLRLGFATGDPDPGGGNKFILLEGGANYTEKLDKPSQALTFYMEVDAAPAVVEIITWK